MHHLLNSINQEYCFDDARRRFVQLEDRLPWSNSEVITYFPQLTQLADKILDNDFHPIDMEDRIKLLSDVHGGDSDLIPSRQTYIGKNCFIGCNSIISKGTVLGDGCVVGAGAPYVEINGVIHSKVTQEKFCRLLTEAVKNNA